MKKHRSNRGETGGLSFYRDRNGAEGDLIIESPSRITLVDVKSTATVSSSLFSGVRRIRRHLTELPRPCDTIIVYGGDQLQKRTDGDVVPWYKLHETDF